MLKNGGKYSEKCNFDIKYFDKIKCYADRPYLAFSELKPETHIYNFFGLMCYFIKEPLVWLLNFAGKSECSHGMTFFENI